MPKRITSARKFLYLLLKGKTLRLDCGHLWSPFHPWANTAVFLADGRIICHNCYD